MVKKQTKTDHDKPAAKPADESSESSAKETAAAKPSKAKPDAAPLEETTKTPPDAHTLAQAAVSIPPKRKESAKGKGS